MADAGSVVVAGSAGTTVTGSASGGCDMVGALLQKNESKRRDKTQTRGKKQVDARRWDIQQAHILSTEPGWKEREKKEYNKQEADR